MTAVAEPEADSPSGSRLGWWAGAAVATGIGLFWIYVFFFADNTPPDRLDNDAFSKAAEQVCASARQELRDAGLYAKKAESLDERAAITEEADGMVAAMVSRLRALRQPSGEDGEAVKAWLADYDIFVADRERWADILRSGKDEEFRETARPSGEPNSKAVDAFAIVNDMDSCQTPDNV